MDISVDLALTRYCHCLAARRRARLVTRYYESALRAHGLRATQFSVLAVLALAGPLTMGRLATLLGLERTTLTRSAGPLERDGWIGAARSPDGGSAACA